MRRLIVGALLVGACRYHFDPLTGTGDADDASDAGDVIPSNEIEVVVTGHGVALVAGQPPCTATCRYTTGPLDITGVAGEAWQLAAYGGGCTAEPCRAPLGTRVTLTFERAPITANVIFVSSTDAPLAGLAGLDAHCSNLATTAGLPGTFVAFVSTSTQDATARVAGARGWVRVDGLPVFDTMVNINSYGRPRGVVLDETGTATTATFAMTASTSLGARTANHCADWTTASGQVDGAVPHSTGERTMGFSNSTCAGGLHAIYCIQAERNTAVTLQPAAFPAGRYIFRTSTPFAIATGVGDMDARCQSDATGAGLPGTYRALVATTSETARDRIGGASGVWRRPDGVVVSFTGLDAPSLDAVLLLDAGGAFATPVYNVWLGAPDIATLATNRNCADWTSTADTSGVLVSDPVSNLAMHRAGQAQNCGITASLYCAQLP